MKEDLVLSNGSAIEFTRIDNDVNGNPRYVCPYLYVLTKEFLQSIPEIDSIDEAYKVALKRAKAYGGKRFHNKQFGGGIVFQSYNLSELKPLFE